MSTTRVFCSLLGIFVATIYLSSCQSPTHGKGAFTTDSTTLPFVKTVIKYAHGFTVDYYDHYKEVKVFTRNGDKTDTAHYLLVPEGQTPPDGHPGALLVRIPIKSLVVMASSHIAQADFAGIADRITGLGNTQYVSSPIVREGIKTGRVKPVGMDANVNNELVITMHPGILVAMINPSATMGQYKTLTDAGVPVLLNAEWMETSPLGRAEWVKLMGVLTNREEIVDRKFDSVEKAYLQLAEKGKNAASKPSVIVGMPFKGTWYVPEGGNYMAQFLQDAGAAYKWADTKGTGSLALNFEAVAPEALTADYWLNIGYVNSVSDVLAKDSRYGSFHSFQSGQVYNFNKRVNDIGSNDYWESGTVNPQLILSDLIHILHPGLLGSPPAAAGQPWVDSLVYYKQLK